MNKRILSEEMLENMRDLSETYDISNNIAEISDLDILYINGVPFIGERKIQFIKDVLVDRHMTFMKDHIRFMVRLILITIGCELYMFLSNMHFNTQYRSFEFSIWWDNFSWIFIIIGISIMYQFGESLKCIQNIIYKTRYIEDKIIK